MSRGEGCCQVWRRCVTHSRSHLDTHSLTHLPRPLIHTHTSHSPQPHSACVPQLSFSLSLYKHIVKHTRRLLFSIIHAHTHIIISKFYHPSLTLTMHYEARFLSIIFFFFLSFCLSLSRLSGNL